MLKPESVTENETNKIFLWFLRYKRVVQTRKQQNLVLINKKKKKKSCLNFQNDARMIFINLSIFIIVFIFMYPVGHMMQWIRRLVGKYFWVKSSGRCRFKPDNR